MIQPRRYAKINSRFDALETGTSKHQKLSEIFGCAKKRAEVVALNQSEFG